jgi:hypothetical protein
MLAAIPNKICCWEGLDGVLDFLFLIVFLVEGEDESDGPTTPNLVLFLSGGRA